MGAAETSTMARPKGRPRKPDRNDVSVKVDRAIASKAKMVAAHRGLSIAEVLSEMLRGPVDRAYAAMLRELEAGEEGDAD